MRRIQRFGVRAFKQSLDLRFVRRRVILGIGVIFEIERGWLGGGGAEWAESRMHQAASRD